MEEWKHLLDVAGAGLGPFGPRLAGAAVLLALAWLGARLARLALTRLLGGMRLEQRLGSPGLTGVLANIGYWLVWLFTLPALLGTLQLEALVAPLDVMLSRLMGFLPNLLGAAVVMGVGVLAARIAREVLTGVLTAAGSERVAVRAGLGPALGERTLAGSIGSLAFALILLPTLTAALQALGLDAVSRPVEHLLDALIGFIPRLITACAVLAIGALLGRLAAGLATTLAAGIGINRLPLRLGMAERARFAGRSPAEWLGAGLMTAVVFLAVTEACDVLGCTILTDAMTVLGGALAHLAVAVVVFLAGVWLADVAARALAAGRPGNANLAGQCARAAVLFFFTALALREAGLPGDIILVAFASIAGGLAIGLALAIGIGGRHLAARLLEEGAEALRREGAAKGAPPP